MPSRASRLVRAAPTFGVMALRVIACGLAALALAAPAGAGSIVVHLGLTAGPLTVTAPRTTLTAGETATVAVTVVDGRGSGAGWTLRLANAPGVSVIRVAASCARHSTCTLPTAAGAAGGSTVLRAPAHSGMGAVALVVTLHSARPAPIAFSVR